MEQTLNRQFIIIEFGLLDDQRFLEFVTKAEFATYLIYRRFIWRGNDHSLGLHKMYHNERKLVSAVSRGKVAEMLGLKDETRVSKHLATLKEMGLIETKATGRETIVVLGEWIDISTAQDKSKRKEWFYIEQNFGTDSNAVPKNDPEPPSDTDSSSGENGRTSDVAQKATSDVQEGYSHQTWRNAPHQTWLKKPHNNREENREYKKTVNGLKNPIKELPLLNLAEDEAQDVANYIAEKLGPDDDHSKDNHLLIAWRIPKKIIEHHLGDILETGVNNPGSLLTHRMKVFASKKIAQERMQPLNNASQNLASKMTLASNREANT